MFARFRGICFDPVPDFYFNSRTHTCSRFLNMAARPKRVAKKPARFSELFCENKSDKPEQKRYKPNNDKTLYNIEVTEVDKENKRLKSTTLDTAIHMTNGENTTETKNTFLSFGTRRETCQQNNL